MIENVFHDWVTGVFEYFEPVRTCAFELSYDAGIFTARNLWELLILRICIFRKKVRYTVRILIIFLLNVQ